MDSKFIELHDTAVSELLSVNVENICYINAYVDPDGMVTTAVGTNDGSLHVVSESYDEVKQMIKDSEILIHKADPRLDTSHPLTYDEMREMPGQPVWHSNTDQWAIIADEPMYADRVTVWHSDGTFTNVSKEDAIAKPWYRMKQGDTLQKGNMI